MVSLVLGEIGHCVNQSPKKSDVSEMKHSVSKNGCVRILEIKKIKNILVTVGFAYYLGK